MMKRKRLLCLYMAAALLLLPVQAFADSSAPAAESSSAEEGVPGLSGNIQEKPDEEPKQEAPQPEPEEQEAPVIRVSVPDTGRVILNPYGLKVTAGGRETTEQVTSASYTLKNESEIPVTVWAKAVGTVPQGSEAVFTSEPPSSDTDGKQAFVYAEFRQKNEDSWSGSYTGEKNQLVVSERDAQSTAVLTLPQGMDGEFRFFGSASIPTSSIWTAKDRVDVTLAFSFTTDDWWAEPGKSSPAKPVTSEDEEQADASSKDEGSGTSSSSAAASEDSGSQEEEDDSSKRLQVIKP